MPDDTHAAISVTQANRLFAAWKTAPALVLAVSGGPDSTALMWLAARWRRKLTSGPRLIAVTVDHGLRKASAREARDVKRMAQTLGIAHRTMRWSETKPKTGLPAAARTARYQLLAKAARRHGAGHIVTAHTRDDQAETLLMRMLRGSGLAGLAAMAGQTPRDGVMLVRPFLDVPKSRLVATLEKARLGFADDPTNHDLHFTRPRLRALMPALAAEGGDSRSLARLASRLARANAAIEVMADGAERYLVLKDRKASHAGRSGKFADPTAFRGATFDFEDFVGLPEEIRVRLLLRAVDRFGHEGPAELGKIEALLSTLDQAASNKPRKGQQHQLKQTLAGALISLVDGRLRIAPAPHRGSRMHRHDPNS